MYLLPLIAITWFVRNLPKIREEEKRRREAGEVGRLLLLLCVFCFRYISCSVPASQESLGIIEFIQRPGETVFVPGKTSLLLCCCNATMLRRCRRVVACGAKPGGHRCGDPELRQCGEFRRGEQLGRRGVMDLMGLRLSRCGCAAASRGGRCPSGRLPSSLTSSHHVLARPSHG